MIVALAKVNKRRVCRAIVLNCSDAGPDSKSSLSQHTAQRHDCEQLGQLFYTSAQIDCWAENHYNSDKSSSEGFTWVRMHT